MPYTKDRSVYANRRYIEIKDYPNHVLQVKLGGSTPKLTRTRTGESVKDYKSIIARQGNATSNMTGIFDSVDLSSARGVWLSQFLNFNLADPPPNDVYYVRADGDFGPQFTQDSPTLGLGVATNRAAISFLKNARQIQSTFSSPIFLGELRETLRMIRSPAQGLRNLLGGYLTQVKKSKKSNPKGWKKNLGGTWLEGMFGWAPLARDITDGYKAYSDLVKSRDNEQRPVSGYGIEELLVPGRTSYNTLSYVGSGGFIPFYTTRITKDKAFVKYRGMVVRRVDATLRDKLGRVGFNAEEFIPTAWELLPWSFLVDYFTNIGDVLTANAFNRAELAWTAGVTVQTRTSRLQSWTTTQIMKDFHGKYFVSFTGEPLQVTQTRRVVNRSKALTVATPTISLELPGRPAQWANMTALFAVANSIHPQSRRRL
jgi:hypothetical protein